MIEEYPDLWPDIEVERYELAHLTKVAEEALDQLSRRDLFRYTGVGLLILCLAVESGAQESGGGRRSSGRQAVTRDVDAWLHIGPDGMVTIFTGKAEVGQNIRTSLAQVAAEELRVPLASVKLVMADTATVPYDMGTFGSMTTPMMSPQIRKAAATAREALLDLAAELWNLNKVELEAASGRVHHRATNRNVTYSALTQGRKFAKTIDANPKLMPTEQWTIAGRSALKVNARDIVTGKHKYTSDLKLTGMLHAKLVRPNAFSGKLVSVDTKAAEKVQGAKVVRDGDFIGVVSPDQFVAAQALESIKSEWMAPLQGSYRNLAEDLKRTATAPTSDRTSNIQGPNAPLMLKAKYVISYIAHAPLEPRAAVAEWKDGSVTIWTGTQRPFGVRSEVAAALRLPEDKVRVIVPDTGSGYGGKHTGETAIEAARLAKLAGKPVKLVWTREEEFTWAYFRPGGLIEVTSSAKEDGIITDWAFHNYNSGGSAIRTPYDIPGSIAQFHNAQSPLRQWSYRALASTANNFARETHMDELAQAMKMDSLAFRLKNLKDERLRAVLMAAAERFGWDKKSKASNRGYGIACGTEKGGFVANCVEVAADPDLKVVRVVRAVTAFECGTIINPEQLKNQVEGAVIMGIGGALFEQIQYESGKILNPRFSKYRVPRFGDVPKLETVLLDRKDLPSAGAGECPIITIAPAIGNAIFDATGKRLRDMPLL